MYCKFCDGGTATRVGVRADVCRRVFKGEGGAAEGVGGHPQGDASAEVPHLCGGAQRGATGESGAANALPGKPAEAKMRVMQAGRGSLEKANRAVKILYVAAKEGGDADQRIFNPEPTFAGMNYEEANILEKIRKEREQAKKESEATKTGWKGLGKRPALYSFKPGFGGYVGRYGGGFGSGAADLNSWALQKLLAQQLGGNKSKGAKAGSKGRSAASGSGQAGQPDYATSMAMACIQYSCHACGIMGHWKKDGRM
jgi:hypothetical protein